MAIRMEGDFKTQARQVRKGLARAVRDLTLLAKTEIQKENPVDTGRSRAAWASKFNAARLRGTVGNNVEYIRLVAEGGVIKAHTIRAKRGGALRFKPKGESQFIFRKSARIPSRKVPSTARERKNIGFHKRGAEKAWRRRGEFIVRGLRREGVQI